MVGKINAKYISPFVGWREDYGNNGMGYVKKFVDIYKKYNFKTKIIFPAVRSAQRIEKTALFGADIITCGLNVYKNSFNNSYTELGLRTFQKA